MAKAGSPHWMPGRRLLCAKGCQQGMGCHGGVSNRASTQGPSCGSFPPGREAGLIGIQQLGLSLYIAAQHHPCTNPS